MSYKTTIIDIARELNTTRATVSRALSNHPGISEKTKQTVHITASRLNYKRSRIASSLRSGKTHVIGVIIPSAEINFFGSALSLLVDIMEKKEQHLKQKVVLDPVLIVKQSSLRNGPIKK